MFLAATSSGTAIEVADSISRPDKSSNLSAYSVGLLIALLSFFPAEKGVDLKDGHYLHCCEMKSVIRTEK